MKSRRYWIPAFAGMTTLLACTLRVYAQDSINPYNTQLPCNIILQNTDVYYNPFAPPASTDTSWQLSNQGSILRDQNGLFPWPPYQPRTHGIVLQNWPPYGVPLGRGAHWQRFFTAKRDSLGNPHDIIAGGGAPGTRVVISKNEDVDFRASGRIKLKSGFHAMAGCRFHAYTEPHWGDTVLTDDFQTFNRSKWYVSNGANDGYGAHPAQCSKDSNVFDTLDPEATDGHALDIIIRMDSCNCQVMSGVPAIAVDSCHGIIDTLHRTPISATFSSANVRACPWPYQQRDTLPLVPAYQHMPYGKFEIREKIPQFAHHQNDWFSRDYGNYELDLNESSTGDDSELFPNLHLYRWYGPFKGMFHKYWTGIGTDSVIFVSHEANFSSTNDPQVIFIDNFPYGVARDWNRGHQRDTLRKDPSYVHWPLSLSSDTTDSVTFYYQRYSGNQTDSITWTVKQDSHGTWRKLYASYRISGTDTFRFSKAYQAQSITLHTSPFTPSFTRTLRCHWEYTLNNPIDSGILYLDDTLSPGDLHSNTEQYQYTINEDYFNNTLPALPYNFFDSMGGYKYHTYSVEILPHELRYLVDSNVVYRFPDRMVPSWSAAFNPAFDRSPMELWIGEMDSPDAASFASHAAAGWPGFRDVYGKPAAHRLIDYVRYWDIPADDFVPNFPN